MPADSVDPAAPQLNLSPDEKRVYGQLFRQADTDNVGVVTGETAVKFFDKTRLDSRVLGEIWQIADKENRGFLTPAGFGIVLRLIGHAQAGREPTPEVALQQGPIPRFEGLAQSLSIGSPTAAAAPALQAQGTGGAVRIPPLMPDKVAQYTGLFERQAQGSVTLPGDQAKSIFEKSGLPNEVLGRIWGLADTEQRGALVPTEFVIAMHLLTSMKTGALRSLPTVLPAALYEAATRRGSISAVPPPPRQSPTSTGLSAIPRQLSGQGASQPRLGSPLGRTPVSPQTTGPAGDWAVTPGDKAKFDQIYSDLDKANKGFITGEEAVPFFSQSNLHEDTLAQIWDLADINSQGHLSRDEFAVAMYLIRQLRSSRQSAPPSALPPNLIPPSMRTQFRPPTANSAFGPPPVAQPAPPKPSSALDDLFGLDHSSPSPTPAAPVQAPMSTGGSNADPFAGGTSSLPPSSPVRATATGSTFKPFIPSSSFGRGLAGQTTGDSTGSASRQAAPSASDDLLGDDDPEASKKLTGESTELANLSNQISSLSKQMQDTQSKRTVTQNELNQTNSQKQNFEQRLSQLRALYEKEAKDTHSLEEQLRNARSETKKLQGDCLTLEGTYRDAQGQHQQILTQLQADQQENTNLRERIRVVSGEIAQLKPQIEKLKSDARQQKGLVAINKKQLATTEGERDKLKTEAEELTKSNEDLSRQINTASPAPAQVASPAPSTASGNNPFFKRTASTDIMGVFASPPARNYSNKSFDDVFGPSADAGPTDTLPAAPAFEQQNTGASSASMGSVATPATASPGLSRQATLTVQPPAPPESRQISSSFLPFGDQTESLSSSRQVSPPASRVEDAESGAKDTVAGNEASTESATAVVGASASKDLPPPPGPAPPAGETEPSGDTAAPVAPGPFGAADQDTDKAKADFDNAFAAFTTAKTSKAGPEAPKSTSAFNAEFPPISDLEREEESDSDSDDAGFDDDFTPTSPKSKPKGQPVAAADGGSEVAGSTGAGPSDESPAVPPKEPADKSAEQPSSPATITNATANTASVPGTSTVDDMDDIFGSAAPGPGPSAQQQVPPVAPPKDAFADLDDEFEGLEDAKEGSADDDFANISRSGLDDFNPVFDSSPPGSQTKSESTAFGNESSFDFVPSNTSSGGPAPASENQQKGADSHDWDAIFAGLDSPTATAAPSTSLDPPPSLAPPSSLAPPPADKSQGGLTRPDGPGRALTTSGEHDDPILKNLTGMGYSRSDALSALEKYDYNLERAANFLASQS